MNRYILQMSALEGYAFALYDTDATTADTAVVAQFKDAATAELVRDLLNRHAYCVGPTAIQ